MPQLSQDLCKRIYQSYLNKEGTQRILAERYSVSRGTVLRIIKRGKVDSALPVKEWNRGKKPGIPEENLTFIADLIKEKPDIVLKEIQRLYNQKFGTNWSHMPFETALKKLNITRKKKLL